MAATVAGHGSDWPIYKGNIYFTGNNDEIIVKNGNLKWLFQADDRVFNPVVSDNKIYFTDRKSNVYCLDEEWGSLLWRINMGEISEQFKAFSRSAGKVKYPLVKGEMLFLSDPIAIYAINKNTGKVLWARTGMRQQNKGYDLSGRQSMPMIDGIYSDPIILDDKIFYGTRNMFISREIINGHLMWDNEAIKSYSGFPTFYDDLVFTQSMDYGTGRYVVHCLNAEDGKEKWAKNIIKPMKIFPPVVYKQKVYIPSSKSMYCLDLKSGETVWIKEYGDFITSSPSFTDRSILFTTGNSNIAVADPGSGNLIAEIEVAPKSGPYYVTIRDQIYIAYNINEKINGKETPCGILKAINFSDKSLLWQFRTPFPGGVSQPVASGGILFFPCGNYIYAVGTEYYSRVVQGGSGYAALPDKPGKAKDEQRPEPPQRLKPPPDPDKNKEIRTRKMEVEIVDEDKNKIPAEIEIKKREKDRVVYSKKVHVDKSGKIDVPEGDGVELLVTAPGYIPRKEIINNDDKKRRIPLLKIKTGGTYSVDNINFEINRAYLKEESLDIIDELIRLMKKDPGLKVEIRGHTDSTGEKEYNQKLSERRADAVTEYMIKNGISPERLKSAGFGETKPIASNDTEEGRSKNRRTEFRFLEK